MVGPMPVKRAEFEVESGLKCCRFVEVGEGFVDVLSQYQTLEHAWRAERLRDLNGLLAELNSG